MRIRESFHHLPVVIALALLVPSLMPVTGCAPKKDPATTDTTAKALSIGPENYAVAAEGRIETGPAISGTLTPKQKATVRAQLAGAVLQTYVEQGQSVGAGTLLARLDDRAMRDAVVSAQSAVKNAQSSLDVAERDEKRQTTLFQAGAISERDLDNARKNTIAAQAALAQARAQLVSAQKQITFTEVHAPFAGKVSEKLVNTGDIVQNGGAMYTIVQPSSMQLEAQIPADQLSVVKVGAPVQFSVTGYPDRVFNGTITRINPSADPATRQVRVYAEIPNTGGTLVGDLFAEGRVATVARTTLTVPTTAIDRRLMKPAVHRLNGGKVEKIDVGLGVLDEHTGRVEILSGIRAGDTVLTGAAMEISAGTAIRILPPSAAPRAEQTSAR
jgi:RND family efflux transporter MFP subunit